MNDYRKKKKTIVPWRPWWDGHRSRQQRCWGRVSGPWSPSSGSTASSPTPTTIPHCQQTISQTIHNETKTRQKQTHITLSKTKWWRWRDTIVEPGKKAAERQLGTALGRTWRWTGWRIRVCGLIDGPAVVVLIGLGWREKDFWVDQFVQAHWAFVENYFFWLPFSHTALPMFVIFIPNKY